MPIFARLPIGAIVDVRTIFIFASVLLAACGGSLPSTQPKEGPPALGATTLERALQRESTGLAEVPFSIADGRWAGTVEAASAPTVTGGDGFWQLNVPIGSEAPISCFIYPGGIDMASTIAKSLDNMKKSVEVKALQVSPADIVGRTPVFRLALVYIGQVDGENRLGVAKEVAATNLDAGLFCLHDEPGYEQTFARITDRLVRAVNTAAMMPDAAELVELEVSLMKINGVASGYTLSSHVRQAEGHRSVVLSSTLASRSETDLVCTDSSDLTATDRGGKILSQHVTHVENGEVSTDIEMKLENGTLYSYSGLLQEKQVKGAFATHEALMADFVHLERFRREYVRQKSAEVAYEVYSPTERLDQPIAVTMRSDTKNTGSYLMKIGDLIVTGDLDDEGREQNGRMELGRLAVEQTRMFLWRAK